MPARRPGAGAGPGSTFDSAGPLTLNEVRVVGDETGPLIGDPASLAVDSSGRVYVADPERSRVWVLTAKGDSVGALGRKGRGPGEFVRPGFVHVGPHDSLFVLDQVNRRVSVFSPHPERAFTYAFRLKPSRNRGPSAIYATPSGAFWSKYTRPKNPNLGAEGVWIVQVNRSGEHRPRRPRSSAPQGSAPARTFVRAPRGGRSAVRARASRSTRCRGAHMSRLDG